MARVIDTQTNTWGKQQGVDPQRADLYVVDFTQALSGIASVVDDNNVIGNNVSLPYVPPKLASYFVMAVNLPELRIRPEMVRRDSKPYMMPSWDEPCDAVRMTFILDCFTQGKVFDPYRSDLYQMLESWRAVVRAGRGGMSSEFAIALDNNYRIDYAYDIGVNLLRPDIPQVGPGTTSSDAVTNDLQFSLQLKLINCWLSSYKLSELNYEAARVLQIEATFYAEDIRQKARNS